MNIDSNVYPLLSVFFFKLNLNGVIIKEANRACMVEFIISIQISVKVELFSPFKVTSSYTQNEACRISQNKAV